MLEQNLNHGEINDRLGMAGACTGAVEYFMGTLDPEVFRLLK